MDIINIATVLEWITRNIDIVSILLVMIVISYLCGPNLIEFMWFKITNYWSCPFEPLNYISTL